MTRVSSESSTSCKVVWPSHKAASNKTRLEMLLEPGSTTVPCALASGGISKKAVEYMKLKKLVSGGRGTHGPTGALGAGLFNELH